ncbi:MAG: nucleotidyltransferase family protein [Bacteroidaceae bacterium]|nr:nucleotidyltransferase family protein [Bacteroidaceae bacterium]
MTDFKETFMYLLRLGLWGQQDEHQAVSLTNEEWIELYKASRKQTVQGIIFDGILLLPEEERPCQEILYPWSQEVAGLEQGNKRQLMQLTQLDFFFNLQHNHPFRILKGQGIAQHYRNRLHRVYGDLDLWFGNEEKVEKANQIMEATGIRLERGTDHESEYPWNGTYIEHHCHLVELHSPFIQKELKAWEEKVFQESKDVPTPCANLMLQITHILKHQLTHGIGLRQICDFAVSLTALNYDAKELEVLCRRFGVYKWTRLLMTLVHQHLNVPLEKLPFPLLSNADQLLNEIWEAGNFGFDDNRFGDRPQGKIAGKLFTVKIFMHKVKTFIFYTPAECFWFNLSMAKYTILNWRTH